MSEQATETLAEQLKLAAEMRRGVGDRTALYRLYDADDELLYVGITKNTAQRWKQHKQLKSWWSRVARRDVAWLDSRPDALLAEHRAIVAEHPLHNSPNDPQGWLPGIKRPRPADMPPALAAELRDTQQALTEGTLRLRLERQQAVMKARAAGWSKYKIAATLGVKGPTVDSIISAAEREQGERS